MLEENYNHLNIEDKIYNFWESNKLFEPKKNKKKKILFYSNTATQCNGQFTYGACS